MKKDESLNKVSLNISEEKSDAGIRIDQLTGDFQVGDSFYTIYKHPENIFEFCCPGVETVLGFTPLEISPKFILARIHPADRQTYTEYDHLISKFFNALPADKKIKYKVRRDFRLKHKSGHDVRVVKQTILTNQNQQNSAYHIIEKYTDITHLKSTNDMTISFIGMSGEPSFHNAHIPNPPALNLLSKRESEILHLISNKYTSGKIAEMLNLSRHTINNHRKNILRKTGSRDILDLFAKPESRETREL